MSELSVTGFGDVSHSIESMANDIMNSSSFAIANSMMQSDIEAMHLTATGEEHTSEADGYHHSLEYDMEPERVVGVEDCSNESFHELVQNASISSNPLTDGSGGSVSTRLRRRKASQPQRLVYCDLDFNLNDDKNANNNNQINYNQNNGSEECKQGSVDEGIGLSSLEDSTQESNDDEDEEEEEVNAAKEETNKNQTKPKVCFPAL